MAGLASVIREVIVSIETETNIGYCRVWNNQVDQSDAGQIYSYPNLSCFIEILPLKSGLGLGFMGGDLTIRFHIVHVEYDAQDGTFEQNLKVFEYRDELISYLQYKQFELLSGLQFTSEQPDYNHSNVYHYVIEFTAHFIEDTGNVNRNFILKQPTTDLEVNKA